MCIINNTHKFIFVHVPKTAGTSVSSYFSGYSTCRDIEIGGTELGEALQKYYLKRYGLSKHSTLFELADRLGQGAIQDFFTFGFVRNPYGRLISSYRFLKKWEGSKNHPALTRLSNVNDFISSDFFHSGGIDRMLNPQTSWLGDPRSSDGRTVDFVGRFENIQESIREVRNALGFSSQEVILPTLNVSALGSSSEDLFSELSRQALDAINEKYRLDFEAYGYSMV